MLTTALPPEPQEPAASGDGGSASAEGTTADAAADTSAATSPPVPRRRGMPGWLRMGLVALLVAALGVTGGLLLQHRDHVARQRASAAALAAARTAAVTVLSYDYRHLDRDFAAASALTTAPFTAEYQRTTTKAVRPVATTTKATVTAAVSAAGVVRAARDRVVVLVFVNQTTQSSRLERPQLDQNRVELTMVRGGDGRWLLAGVKAM